jgi:hypothetical protein
VPQQATILACHRIAAVFPDWLHSVAVAASLGFGIDHEAGWRRAAGMGGGHGHPYSPAELQLPGFVPQRLSQAEILAPFLGASLLVALAVWLVSGSHPATATNPPFTNSDPPHHGIPVPPHNTNLRSAVALRSALQEEGAAADYPGPTACSCAGGRSRG